MQPHRRNDKPSARATGLFQRAVSEAIDAVAAPAVRDRVLGLALAWGHHATVPEQGREVREFVEGPLHRALEHALGATAAQSVEAELAPVVACLSRREVSSVRPSWPGPSDDDPELEIDEPEVRPRGRSAETDPAPSELQMILVASSDPGALSALGLALGGAAGVEPVGGAVEMLEALGRAEAMLIVLDCRHPTMRAETLLAMQPELPHGTRVIFWGEQAALEQQLQSLSEGLPESFVFCGRNATADDVAAICRILLE